MSCMILKADNIAAIASAMHDFLEVNTKYNDDYSAVNAFEAFKSCETAPGEYDTHKLYRRLYIENLRAYNGRYNEDVKEFEKYRPHRITDKKQLYRTIGHYIYQLSEDATFRGTVIKAAYELQNSIAHEIIKPMIF